MQMRFMSGKGTINAMFIRQEKKLYLIFVHLEKAFDHVLKVVGLKKGVIEREVFAILEMYKHM